MTYRSVLVTLRANADQFNREMRKAGSSVNSLRKNIDTTNDRTAWLTQGLLAIGPALAPLGAAAIPVLAGLATQATVAVGAMGTMALAFDGVGEGLSALNKYQLEPTAENLEALQLAMQKIGPDGAEFVRFLDDVGGQLSVLQMDARAGMFPGMTEGIEEAMRLLPRMRVIVTEIAEGIGELSAQGGAALAGPEFREFFRYLSTEAKPLLSDMGRTFGNFVDGFASMIVAFGPLTSDFSGGLLGMSRSFEEWAEGLERSATFQEFVQYIREAGPKALELLGAISEAFVELAEAAAPVGDIMLPILTDFFEIVAKIANTPVGSFLILTAALTGLYGRFQALRSVTTGGVIGGLTGGLRESTSAAKAATPTFRQFGLSLGYAMHSNETLKRSMLSGSKIASDSARSAFLAKQAVGDFGRAAGPAAASGALLALTMTGVADSAGLGNTTMGAMVGLMTTGGPWGLAVGGAIGLTADLAASMKDMESATKAANEALKNNDMDAMIATLDAVEQKLNDIGVTEGVIGSTFGQLPALWGGDTWFDKHDDMARAASELRSEIEFTKEALGGKGWDTTGMEVFYEGLGITGDRARIAAMGVDQFSRAVERALGILDKQADFDAFEAAVDNARQGFKEWGATLDAGTEKGRANRENLREIARTALTASENLRGLARADYLEASSKRLANMADLLGMGEKAAERWARRMLGLSNTEATPTIELTDKEARRKVMQMLREMSLLDGLRANPGVDLVVQQFLAGKITVERMMKFLNGLNANPNVTVDNTQAISAITAARSALNTLPRVIPITLHVSRSGVDAGSGLEFGSGGRQADGGTIPGPRLPYADKMLILAAPGEEVISNRYGQADRFRADRAAGRIPRYADGGTVAPIYTRAGNNNVEREANETARGLRRLRAELKAATTALEREKKQRDALVDKMKQLSGDVSGGLRSDLFGETNAWGSEFGGGSPEGVMGTLRGDIGEARQMTAAIRTLRKNGLNGAALAEVLSQGGLAGAQAFAELSRAELREFAELYNRRNRALRDVGQLAGNAAYGSMLRESRQEYRELKQEVVRLRRAVERNGRNDREDNRQNRNANRRGAGNGARNRRKD